MSVQLLATHNTLTLHCGQMRGEAFGTPTPLVDSLTWTGSDDATVLLQNGAGYVAARLGPLVCLSFNQIGPFTVSGVPLLGGSDIRCVITDPNLAPAATNYILVYFRCVNATPTGAIPVGLSIYYTGWGVVEPYPGHAGWTRVRIESVGTTGSDASLFPYNSTVTIYDGPNFIYPAAYPNGIAAPAPAPVAVPEPLPAAPAAPISLVREKIYARIAGRYAPRSGQ